MIRFIYFIIISFTIGFSESIYAIEIQDSVNNTFRSENNKKRDKYRNPIQTLKFFGLDHQKKILEIAPGRGWYTEIISHYMSKTQNYYVTNYTQPTREIISKIQKEFQLHFEKNASKFGGFKIVEFDNKKNFEKFEKNYFDLVLTFRNTHNWLDAQKAGKVYESINKIMRLDGILGVVQHRADEKEDFNYKLGYVKESFLIRLIESKGFKLVEKSEINANYKDKKNYPDGVWTLPPRLVNKEINKEKYLKIGESDRMTLKFVKTKNL